MAGRLSSGLVFQQRFVPHAGKETPVRRCLHTKNTEIENADFGVGRSGLSGVRRRAFDSGVVVPTIVGHTDSFTALQYK